MRGMNKMAMLGSLLAGSVAGMLARNATALTATPSPGVGGKVGRVNSDRAPLRQARLYGATPNVTASRKGSILRKMTIERVTVRDKKTGELHTVERTVPGSYVYPQTKKMVARTLGVA